MDDKPLDSQGYEIRAGEWADLLDFRLDEEGSRRLGFNSVMEQAVGSRQRIASVYRHLGSVRKGEWRIRLGGFVDYTWLPSWFKLERRGLRGLLERYGSEAARG